MAGERAAHWEVVKPRRTSMAVEAALLLIKRDKENPMENGRYESCRFCNLGHEIITPSSFSCQFHD